MTDSRIAKRYARALFQASLKDGSMANVDSDLSAIADAFRNSDAIRTFFSKPSTSDAQKLSLLEKALGGKSSPLTLDFLKLLIKKRRDSELSLVRMEFAELRREHENVTRAVVTSAEELSDDQKKKIVDVVAKKIGRKVESEFHVDPSLLGGVKVAYDNFVLDGTVRGDLNRIRERMLYDLLKQA